MSTITLPNIRVSSDLTVSVRLKDNGVAIDWSTLNNVKASIYSDAQRALAGRCDVSVDAEDPTVLVCQYAANKPQYVGVCRIVVSAKYMGETKTYDKPAFNFVRWTADQDGEQITIDDPDVDVEIDVADVSSSLLDEAIRAAFTAAEEAVDAKGQVLETEAEVEAAEALRVSAEESRVEAEEGRAEAEAARVDEEAVRVSAEDARVVAENARAAAEDLREGAEDDRAAAETARETAEAARVAAEALRVTAEGSRETAEAAREAQASADHTVAAGDHMQAAADHTQAAADHTTAASDHTQAGADHTLAAADHVTAGEDHAQAQDDHEVMAGYDTRLGNVEGEVSQLEAEIDGVVVEHFTRGGSINSGGTVTANDTYCYSDWIPVTGGLSYTVDYGTPADTQNEVFYNSEKSKLDYWPLYPSYGPLKTVTAPASSAYLRFSFLPSYNAKVYQGETLIWQAQDITPGLEDRVESLEGEVSDIDSELQTLSGEIDSVKDDVSKIAVDKNAIDCGIKAGYKFSRISGTPLENITVSETETGINIAKTGGTSLTFKIILPKISEAGTYHIVFSSNKEMTSANIYKDETYDSEVQATDNVCEFDYVYDGTYVLAIGTTMFYNKSSQDYSLVATIPNATGMTVLADNISERVQVLEDSAQTPIPASVEGTNTFIGDGAGQNNTPIEGSDNGKYNTAVGKNAMLYNTLGDHCTALGFCALNKNQDGRNNTALGEDALYENLHGGQNVAIGQHSGQDSQGGYNVLIGSNVARRMASGDLNVIIGAEAYNDYNQLGGSNMVLIGAYVRNSGNYDGVISIRGEEPTAAKQIRIGKADFSAFIIGNKKLNFNQDGTVTWEDVTPTP